MFDRYKTQLRVVIFVLIAVSASIIYLIPAARYQRDIPFLRGGAEANWIMYYLSPDTNIRGDIFTNITTDFVKDFNLPDMPHKAELHIRAFKKYRLWVNDAEFPQSPTTKTNWKRTDTLDISRALVKGRNTIKVQVTCDYGPPGLWLYASGLHGDIKTDATWMTSISGSPYTAASLERDCFVYPGASEGPQPLRSFAEKLPIFILSFCASFAVFYIRRRTKADKGVFARLFAFTPKFVLTVSTIIWAIVFINNVPQVPFNLGFDVQGHLEYIRHILTHGTIPLANQGWQAYQPPLFYVFSTLFFSIAKSISHNETANMALKLVPFLCGVEQIFIAYFASKALFPSDTNKQSLCTAFAAMIPMNIYISHYVSNESACAFLTGLLILVAIVMLKKGCSTKLFCILGTTAGLALLTKYTTLVALPVIALMLLYKLITEEKRSPANIIGYFGIMAAIIAGLAGWFYFRNWVNFGKIFVGNWDPVTGNNWWQDPGVHTYRYFCRFGEVFTAPYYLGFHSFFDAIYASFWGDSMLGGRLRYGYGPPWNYEYVTAVYILSVPATLIIIIGAALAVRAAIFRNDKGWLLILGLLFAALWSTVYMNLRIPYYAQPKAFYSLFAVMPIALTFSFGFGELDKWLKNKGLSLVRAILYGWFGTLAIAIFLSFFVSSVPKDRTPDFHALAREGRLNETIGEYTKLLKSNPNIYYPHLELASSYALQGKYDDAIKCLKEAERLRPDWPETLNALSTLLFNKPNATASEREEAVRYAERSCQLTGYLWDNGLFTLAQAYMAEGKASLGIKTAERAMEEAKANKRTELAMEIGKRLEIYKASHRNKGENE